MLSKSRKRSDIWHHFTYWTNGSAKCGYCGNFITAKDGSTGNLLRHLKRKHVDVAIVCQAQRDISPLHSSEPDKDSFNSWTPKISIEITPKQSVLQKADQSESVIEFLKPTRPLRISKVKTLDRQLVKMIVREYHPFRIVDDTEFRKFVKMLRPQYDLPTRKALSNTIIPQIYDECKAIIAINLESAIAVCVTTDGWTSVNNESFVAVTAHF